MKFAATLFLLLTSTLNAQYQYKSQYLKQPERVFGYVDSCAQFWMQAYDPAAGGFFTNINQLGYQTGSTVKNAMNQSRNAYGFVRAFQMTGDTTYLNYARRALSFMYRSAWDATYGGWFNDVNAQGQPINPATTAKTAFYQHYALLGIAAMYEATRDTADWNWLMRGYAYNDQYLWDANASTLGYFDKINANSTSPSGKSFNATVDAVTTHVLHLYLMTGEQKYKTRLLQLADNMINRLAASVPQQAIGFAEVYNTAWAPVATDSMTIMGHVLKTGWCLARIYELEKNPAYLATAEQLVQMVLDKGYDHQYGGPYKDYNRTTGAMLMWGITDTAKAWWQMEQAITSGLMLYSLTGKTKYLQMADETLDFYMTYFVDHVYGDVFENRARNGGFISKWGATKGGGGKAGYHSIETGYYVYLYQKLLVAKEPATLHYRFAAASNGRVFRLTPVGLPENALSIASVTLNGQPYAQFTASTRDLNVPAGTEGIFAVTFLPAASVDVRTTSQILPTDIRLMQNFPNPFNPTTAISYELSATSHMSLKVFDILGREVAFLVNEEKPAGSYQVTWDASGLPSGTFFVQLRVGDQTLTRKMLLMR